MKKVLYLLIAISLLLIGCAKANDPLVDTHKMKVIQTYTTIGNPIDIDSHGNMLFIADDFGGYHIYNSNSGELIKSANYYMYAGIQSPLQVKIIRYDHLSKCMILLNRLNSSNWNMEFFSLNDPANPTLLDYSSGDTVDLKSIVLEASADTSKYDFAIYRTSKSSSKLKYSEVKLGSYPIQHDIRDVETSYPPEQLGISEEYVFVCYGQLGVTIFNKNTFDKVASFDTPGYATAVKYHDGYIYVADRQAGFHVYKLDTNMNVEHIYTYNTTSGYAENIEIKDNYAALSWNSQGVFLFDISNPLDIKLADRLPSTVVGYVNNIHFSEHERSLFVASRDKGVLKIEY
ncbi:MAG: hypothetical protein RBS16_05665 [Candidatus Cloacimonadales bacterium]|jgi:hypothetical protein|nr:hypothetical protein [Candidatus Cloacimonadota bacterium]MDD2649684.1 hypothetical protein [Candidatus Cloacimonadota bacterium]MDX9977508.1 hypothetical protein [Candidatus Cloacimonadales bacterium]